MNKSTALRRLRSLHCCLWLLVALLLAGTPAQAAKITVGDILVVDAVGGTNFSGALFLVNPVSGARSILSDFGNPAQGSLGNGDLTGVAREPDGRIFVSTLFSGSGFGGAIFEVDRQSGNRTLVSDFGQGTLQGFLYYGLAATPTGKVLADSGPFSVVRVDPETDNRVLVSDFSNPAQGETVSPDGFITDLALEKSGTILAGAEITENFSTNTAHAAIFQVNPKTGERTLFSDFANPAQGADAADLFFSTGLAKISGQILVNSGGSIFAPRNLLLRIDPKTGNRTVLSDFDNPAQGTPGAALHGLGKEESGNIILAASTIGSANAQSLFRVDRRTGTRALLSDSGNPAQGPPFVAVVYLAVVP